MSPRMVSAGNNPRRLPTYCHQEVIDEDGHLEACNYPATTARWDPENRESYPVCTDHKETS